MNLEELGASLRIEREKRRLSIESVANELKINPRILRALESGDSARLPPPAYIRGFIRTYAAFLGLKPDELQHEADDISSKNVEPPAAPLPPPPTRVAPPKKSGSSSLKKIWFLVLLAGLAGAGYFAWETVIWPELNKEHAREITSIETLPNAGDWTAAKDEPANETPGEKTTPVIEDNKTLALPPVNISKNDDKIDQPVESPKNDAAIAAETLAQNEAKEEPAPKPAITHHKVIITAKEECWVHSNADKTDTRQFSLRKGDTFALTFANSLQLKLGNAGGVVLRYDGEELPPAGTSGQVKTISFPPKDN